MLKPSDNSDSRYPEITNARWYIWSTFLMYAIWVTVWLLASCGTVAPKIVTPKEIAWNGNSQNAGIIDCNQNGCIVTYGWLERYKGMEKSFSHQVAADAQIRPEGTNFLVSYEVVNHYVEMKLSERNP